MHVWSWASVNMDTFMWFITEKPGNMVRLDFFIVQKAWDHPFMVRINSYEWGITLKSSSKQHRWQLPRSTVPTGQWISKGSTQIIHSNKGIKWIKGLQMTPNLWSHLLENLLFDISDSWHVFALESSLWFTWNAHGIPVFVFAYADMQTF